MLQYFILGYVLSWSLCHVFIDQRFHLIWYIFVGLDLFNVFSTQVIATVAFISGNHLRALGTYIHNHLLDTLQALKIYRHALNDVSYIYSYVLWICWLSQKYLIIFLQWSPTEADVFASCSVDGTICIWDVRTEKKLCMSIKAHNADVNVISWNRYLLGFFYSRALLFLLYTVVFMLWPPLSG